MQQKLLFLHGYCQNAQIFKQRCSVLRKAFEKQGITCIFIDGPHKATTSFSNDPERDERSWWNSSNDDPPVYNGLAESIDYIKKVNQELGPFKGVFGFSQGAAMASIIADIINADCCILCGGFLARDQTISISFKGPCLHVIGDNDEIIPKDASLMLQKVLNNGHVLIHDGGHIVPQKAEYKNQIIEFVNRSFKSSKF